MENWRPIPGHPRHEISDMGRVRLAVRGHFAPKHALIAQKVERNGYARACLCSGGSARFYQVSRLVLMAFVGPPPTDRHQAAHYDGVRTNNNLTNLRWAHPIENMADQERHGTRPRGSQKALSRITEDDVRVIRELHKMNLSIDRIARLVNANFYTVQGVTSGDRWRHVR